MMHVPTTRNTIWQAVGALALIGALTLNAAEPESWMQALTGGSPALDVRLRYENAETDGALESDAVTLRTRLGYGTAPYHGARAFVEFEDVTSLVNDDGYSQAGLNPAGADKTVIADVEGTEWNQAFVELTCPISGVALKGGRQRIILGNARFVGNVGWRQNEQTYDAVTVSTKDTCGLKLTYAYVDAVRRIFGQENGSEPAGAAGNAAKYESDSHLVNLTYKPGDAFTTTAYAYLLDLGDEAVGAANSSDTHGITCVLKMGKKEDEFRWGGELEYARQNDNSASPDDVDYEADYVKADLNAGTGIIGIGGGLELLGSDSGNTFRTPLATGHKYNGWADVFLTAPAQGLRDTYAYASVKCPRGIGPTIKVVFHDFESDVDDISYGTEIDVVAVKKFGKHFTLIAKYADYNASSGTANPRPADVTRFSVQAGMAF